MVKYIYVRNWQLFLGQPNTWGEEMEASSVEKFKIVFKNNYFSTRHAEQVCIQIEEKLLPIICIKSENLNVFLTV